MANERVHFRFIVCTECQHQICWVNPRLPSFCPECGRPTVQAELAPAGCTGCGVPLPPETKFCPKCGAKQAVADVPQVAQVDKWKNTAASLFKR